MIEIPEILKTSLEGSKVFSLNCVVHIYPTEDTFSPLNPNLSSSVHKQTICLGLTDYTLESGNRESGIGSKWVYVYKPLLNKIPVITESIDLISNKHTLQKCTLDISNRIYEDERFSDKIKDLLGRIVTIHFFDKSTTYVEDTLLIYTGIIKRYKQTDRNVQLELEDMSSVKFNIDVPEALLPMTEEVRADDRGKPYPMVYGYVEDAPLRQTQVLENLSYVFGNFICDKSDFIFTIDGVNWPSQNRVLGPYIIDKMYSQNPYLQSNQHYLNSDGTFGQAPSVTPYGHVANLTNAESAPPLKKDFLYVHDEDLVPISRSILAGLGLSFYDGVRTGITSVGMGQYTDIETYQFDWNDNTIRLTDEYDQWWSDRATNLEQAIYDNPSLSIEIPTYALFGRVYRPIKRVTFHSTQNYKSGPSGSWTAGVKFFGFNENQSNGGVDWNRTANMELIQSGLMTGIPQTTLDERLLSANVDSTTEMQYQHNWAGDILDPDNGGWWIPWDVNLGGVPNDGTGTAKNGSVDDFWILSNRKGEQNEFVGEFPVHYLQNGNAATGLFMQGLIFDDEISTGYAHIIFDEYKSTKLKASAKIFAKYRHNIDILTSVTFTSHQAYNWYTHSVIGFSGFTHNSKPVSESSAFFNHNITDYDRQDNWKNLHVYGYAQDTFKGFGTDPTNDNEAGFPYGPEYHALKGINYSPSTDPEGTEFFYDYTQSTFPAGAGNVTGESGYQEDLTSQFQTLSSLNSMKWSVPSQSGSNGMMNTCRQALSEMYVFQDVMVDDIQGMNFYMSLAGRVWDNFSQTSGNSKDEFDENGNKMPIQRPYSIIAHMFQNEVKSSSEWLRIDDDEIDSELNEWKMSFVIDKQTKFKNIVEDIFSQSLTMTRFETNGRMTFLTHKRFLQSRLGEGDVEYNTINVEDITKYKYSLTKSEEITNAINVRYSYSNANKKNQKETGFSIISNVEGLEFETLDDFNAAYYPNQAPYSIEYYNFLDEETVKTIEAKYINDENIARKLQRKLLMWYANQHLIINIDLHNKYISLQVGDIIEFDKLIDNTKAFGLDYTKNSAKNGQLVYNKFIITKVVKDGKKVKITCIQLHRLELGFPDGFFDDRVEYYDNGNIVSEDGVNLNSLFNLPDGEIIPPDDTITEDDDDWEQEAPFYSVNWINTDHTTVYTSGEGKSMNISTNLGYEDVYYRIYFIGCNYPINVLGQNCDADTPYLINVTDMYTTTITEIDANTKRLLIQPNFTFEAEDGVNPDFIFMTKIIVSPTELDNTLPEYPTYDEIEDAIEEIGS